LTGPQSLVEKVRIGAASASVSLQKLRGNVSVVMGAGGNIGVLAGRNGKLIIDAGYAGSRPRISDALVTISSDPIKHLINTHWHFDHTDGNEWLHNAGAEIIAHENTRNHLSADTRVEAWDFTFSAAPTAAIPTTVFKDEHELNLNGTTVLLKHYGNAHTDSDISVHFVDADILLTGDTFWNGAYPFIDYSTGGSLDGQIRAAETNLATATGKTVVVPGHGPVGRRADLTMFRDVLVEIREKVLALKQEGLSLPEIVAAKPSSRYDAQWGQGFTSPSVFVSLVYQGV
jgi:glyoxylase-like metal-dependent hydrolase (beta-lactamase superfamily II)